MRGIMEKKLLKPREVEKIYRIDAGTLANWRYQGRGPSYVKYGRKVLYPVIEMDRWAKGNMVKTVDSV